MDTPGDVYSIAMLAEGSTKGWLASGSEDSTIKVWDLEERKEVRTLRGHKKAIYVVRKYSSDGNLVSYFNGRYHQDMEPVSRPKANLLMTISGHGIKCLFNSNRRPLKRLLGHLLARL